ncbi:MAG: cupin domain-containing protein [Parvularculaceae bacterium]
MSATAKKINLGEAFAALEDYWSPRIAGDVNDAQVKIAKIKGEFDWHAHEAEDEAFLVVKGAMRLEFRDHAIEMTEGDFLVVPRGVEHRPVAAEECWILMVEPSTTVNTGAARTARTKLALERL